MMSIGFVINGDETYGVHRFLSSVATELSRRRVRVHFYAMGPGALVETLRAAGIEVDVSEHGSAPNYASGWRALPAAFALSRHSALAGRTLIRWIRRLDLSAVIVRMPNLVFITAICASIARTRSYWIMPNSVSGRYPRHINKHLYDRLFSSTGMRPIANSSYTRTTLLNRRVNARVMHLGVDPHEFDDDETGLQSRQQLGLSAHDAVFGIFARLVPEKGQELVIRALSAIRDPTVKLLIVGGDTNSPYGMSLQQVARSLRDESRVIFTGSRNDLRQLYSACDVVMNARIDPEPFGLSVIEAMLVGRPVLAHAAGGPGETIIDGKTGWLVDAASVADFRAGLSRALEDRGRWRDMGAAARSHATRHFSVAAATDRLLAILSSDALAGS